MDGAEDVLGRRDRRQHYILGLDEPMTFSCTTALLYAHKLYYGTRTRSHWRSRSVGALPSVIGLEHCPLLENFSPPT